jgi:hypothetical protein
MGTPFKSDDIPKLVDSYVHLASPKFWSESPCITGKVTFVEVSNEPKVVYVQPYGLGYSVRVDISEYEIAEKIEENEQH